MAKSRKDGLTPLELKLMQALWSLGSGTVAEVQEQMRPEPAYTTVQTMLNILERKGRAKRVLRGKAYVYRAAVSREKARGGAVRDLLERRSEEHTDRKSTRLNSSHSGESRMPSSA